MKLSLTIFAVLFYVVLATSAPLENEARDKRHLLVAPAPAVVRLPLIAPAPYYHAPVIVGPHWGSALAYGHPATIIKHW